MEHQSWIAPAYDRVLEWNMTLVEMTEDFAMQLAKNGLRVHRSIQTNYAFNMIATSGDGRKFAQVLSCDVREEPGWLEKISIYRLDDSGKPTGEAPVVCDWDNVGDEVAKILA